VLALADRRRPLGARARQGLLVLRELVLGALNRELLVEQRDLRAQAGDRVVARALAQVVLVGERLGLFVDRVNRGLVVGLARGLEVGRLRDLIVERRVARGLLLGDRVDGGLLLGVVSLERGLERGLLVLDRLAGPGAATGREGRHLVRAVRCAETREGLAIGLRLGDLGSHVAGERPRTEERADLVAETALHRREHFDRLDDVAQAVEERCHRTDDQRAQDPAEPVERLAERTAGLDHVGPHEGLRLGQDRVVRLGLALHRGHLVVRQAEDLLQLAEGLPAGRAAPGEQLQHVGRLRGPVGGVAHHLAHRVEDVVGREQLAVRVAGLDPERVELGLVVDDVPGELGDRLGHVRARQAELLERVVEQARLLGRGPHEVGDVHDLMAELAISDDRLFDRLGALLDERDDPEGGGDRERHALRAGGDRAEC